MSRQESGWVEEGGRGDGEEGLGWGWGEGGGGQICSTDGNSCVKRSPAGNGMQPCDTI